MFAAVRPRLRTEIGDKLTASLPPSLSMTVDLGISRTSLFLLGFALFLTLKFVRVYHEKSKVEYSPSSWRSLILVKQLDHIPTLGPNGVFSSYVTVFKWITKATEIVEEGYRMVRRCSLIQILILNGTETAVPWRHIQDSYNGRLASHS